MKDLLPLAYYIGWIEFLILEQSLRNRSFVVRKVASRDKPIFFLAHEHVFSLVVVNRYITTNYV